MSALLRPIYFYITFWGEGFRAFFADGLLRSLLAPDNLPVLSLADGHKFLICCPKQDWTALLAHPAFIAASRYVTFVHLPTEPPPPGRHPVDHMAVGHADASTVCFEDKAYGSLLHPDMMFADGFVAALLRHIERGTQALLVPALRLGEARLFARLPLEIGSGSGAPLAMSPRAVVAAVIESFHDEIIECEMEGPRFSMLPNCVWWRHGNGDLLVHSFTWSPLLLDYGSIPQHVLTGLVGPLPDGDYVARNFGPETKIEVVSDSDEIAFASWTPEGVGGRERRRSVLQNMPFVGRLLRLAILRRAYLYYTRNLYPFGDHAKARGFLVPLKLHTADIDPSWTALEVKAQEVIVDAAGDLIDPPLSAPTWRTRVLDRIIPWLGAYEREQLVLDSLRFIARRARAAVRGDRQARAWFAGRLRARLRL